MLVELGPTWSSPCEVGGYSEPRIEGCVLPAFLRNNVL